MKRWLIWIMMAVLLSGCGNSNSDMDQMLITREKLLKSGCSFHAVVTADYGDRVYTFGIKSTANQHGDVAFEVNSPQSICGITGEITEEKGTLTFDDKVLAFVLMADGQITPVSAPWILVKTLRSGYIHASEKTDKGMHIQIDDSYREDALRLDIWFNEENNPYRAEFFYKGRRIITMEVDNFTFL